MTKRFYVLILIALIPLLISGGTAEKGKKNNYRHAITRIIGKSSLEVNENQYKFDVIHYDLKLDLMPEEKTLAGEMIITAVKTDPDLKEVFLNFYDNMKVSELLLNQKKIKYSHEDNCLVIKEVPLKDTFQISIKYKGTPKKAGLSGFVFGKINGNSAVYNLNEPNYASTWYPCNDIPSDKALFDIAITNDSSRTSVSNGMLAGVETNGKRRTYHWKCIYPIATYLVCVYSSDYVLIQDKYISQDGKDTMPLLYYLFRKDVEDGKKDLKDHPSFIKFFADTFGEYPFIKEKYGVAEFLWQLGAMEHQTMTGIGSNFINGREFFTEVYIHELAHHWWGNAVTPSTWNDIWLNEGFSTYCEALYAESYAGSKALRSTMQRKFDDNFYGILYEPDENLFSSTVYDKGAWVLHMLRWEVGDSVFFNILRTYFKEYKYKNASTEDFRRLCEKISGKDLLKFFDQWIYKGEGSIKAEYSYSTNESDNGVKITFKVRQIQENYKVYHFPLEVKLTLENNKIIKKVFYIDQINKSFDFLIDSPVKKLETDPDDWLLAVFTEE